MYYSPCNEKTQLTAYIGGYYQPQRLRDLVEVQCYRKIHFQGGLSVPR